MADAPIPVTPPEEIFPYPTWWFWYLYV